eukprot:scaffold192294_cov24-Cyclotella_meneghiniana.AAC.1
MDRGVTMHRQRWAVSWARPWDVLSAMPWDDSWDQGWVRRRAVSMERRRFDPIGVFAVVIWHAVVDGIGIEDVEPGSAVT